ncbi:unnamed protein product, partial [Rhizoctonia solani]
MASSYFCCCLPVRLGVLILSLLSLTTGGISATGTWYVYSRIQQASPGLLKTPHNVAFILSGMVYTLLVVAALMGIIVAQVAVSVFAIYASFRH